MSKKTKKNPINSITNYFKEVRAELKKVVWPTFKQIKNNTTIVIISLILVGFIIWVFDLGFAVSLGNIVEKAPAPQNNQVTDENTIPIGEDDFEQQIDLDQFEDEQAQQPDTENQMTELPDEQ